MRDQALAQVAAGVIAFEELRDLLPTERLAPEVPVEPPRRAMLRR
jgi:hypothetical protein